MVIFHPLTLFNVKIWYFIRDAEYMLSFLVLVAVSVFAAAAAPTPAVVANKYTKEVQSRFLVDAVAVGQNHKEFAVAVVAPSAALVLFAHSHCASFDVSRAFQV